MVTDNDLITDRLAVHVCDRWLKVRRSCPHQASRENKRESQDSHQASCMHMDHVSVINQSINQSTIVTNDLLLFPAFMLLINLILSDFFVHSW